MTVLVLTGLDSGGKEGELIGSCIGSSAILCSALPRISDSNLQRIPVMMFEEYISVFREARTYAAT